MAEHDASERPDTVEDLWQDVSAVMETRPDACARCGQPAEMEMLQVDMSEFRGKLVAKVRCAACGYTAAEAKPSSELPYLGGHFELKLIPGSNWQSRTLIKSNTTVYSIPDIGLDSARAGSAARITVLELLENTRRELLNAPSFGDMEHAEGMLQLASFMQQLQDVMDDTMEATLVLSDRQQQMCFIESKLDANGTDPHWTTTPTEAAASQEQQE